MNDNLKSELDRRQAQIVFAQAYIDKIKTVATKFPDLVLETDRWKRERWGAKSANPFVTKVGFHHSCGCCSDSPLYATCSLDIDGFIVHSYPITFDIGQKDPCTGCDEPSLNWETKLQSAGIPESILVQIREYFNKEALTQIELKDDESDAYDQ